jgi:hypothetical protein
LFSYLHTADQQTNPGPQAKVVKPESYAAAAFEFVKKQHSVDGINLEISGDAANSGNARIWLNGNRRCQTQQDEDLQ